MKSLIVTSAYNEGSYIHGVDKNLPIRYPSYLNDFDFLRNSVLNIIMPRLTFVYSNFAGEYSLGLEHS